MKEFRTQKKKREIGKRWEQVQDDLPFDLKTAEVPLDLVPPFDAGPPLLGLAAERVFKLADLTAMVPSRAASSKISLVVDFEPGPVLEERSPLLGRLFGAAAVVPAPELAVPEGDLLGVDEEDGLIMVSLTTDLTLVTSGTG